MSIVRAATTSTALAGFTAGLEHAAAAVFRIDRPGADPSVCTGWAITDRLVVVPHFAVIQSTVGDPFTCLAADGALSLSAHLVYLPGNGGVMTHPALLELDQPRTGPPPSLEESAPTVGSQIVILHHPLGRLHTEISFGQVLAVQPDELHYDTNTSPGSSGAPVFIATTMAVVGMHVGYVTQPAPVNRASTLASVLDGLRSSPFWPQIAEQHKLANVGAAHAGPSVSLSAEKELVQPDATLLRAAVSWSLDPKTLEEAEREKLRPLVADSTQPRWSVPADERRRLLMQAGSLTALRAAPRPEDGSEPGQRAIDRILAGPPFDLSTIDDQDLPYWLQAVRWFAGIVPGLPTPAEVHRQLSRRRTRAQLRSVAGERLWGREPQLDLLTRWYQQPEGPPVALTGIGGVGKSALVAQFAINLPSDTVLLWLDFDRADLAPDDALSVLSSLAEQVEVQLPEVDLPPAPDESAWLEAVGPLGQALAGLGDSWPPLLVLDGFEIAQHVLRYEEIWDVLGRLLEAAPAIRVLVSGRAPVQGLTLAGRPAQSMHLTGIPDAAARSWLQTQELTDPAVSAVLRIARGVPLILKLAVRLFRAGDDLASIPDELPRRLVDGYLYQRILHRVVDRALRPLAEDALVLRRLSPELIADLLDDKMPPGLTAEEVFARLSRELALIESPDEDAGPTPRTATGELRARPEVRAATLRLLELAHADRVHEIDRRAADWYRRQQPPTDATAAELIYHSLRLGDIAAAKGAWRDGCIPLLLNAEDDIPEAQDAARGWLRERLMGAASPTAQLRSWEQEAAGRIQAALSRGKLRIVPQILGENAERAPGSPLLAYDAWLRWRMDGDLTGARALLTRADDPEPSSVGRQRAVLAARMAAEDRDPDSADDLLVRLDEPAQWADRPGGFLEALAVRAARVRLAVALETEIWLGQLARSGPTDQLLDTARSLLTPGDVVLPSFYLALDPRSGYEWGGTPLLVPSAPTELTAFAARLDSERAFATGGHLPSELHLVQSHEPGTDPTPSIAQLGFDLGANWPEPRGSHNPAAGAASLAVLAWRRWQIATHTTFLADAEAVVGTGVGDRMGSAIAATLAVYRGQPLRYRAGSVDEVLRLALKDDPFGPVDPDRWPSHVREALEFEARWSQGKAAAELLEMRPTQGWRLLPSDGWFTGHNALAVYLLGPDPLDLLYRRVLGIPDTVSETWS